MKKLKRNMEKFDAFELFASFGAKSKLKLTDERSIDEFTKKLNSSLKKDINPILVHGKRTEILFGYLAASLGNCSLIKQEDNGLCFYDSKNISIPDYRIITNEGHHFLVEVKNFKPKNKTLEYTMNEKYFEGLIEYSKTMNVCLKVAIFWSNWRIWTLCPYSAFQLDGNEYVISLENAMKKNKMYYLGDAMIGTTPKLSLRLIPNINETNEINDNEFKFTIGKVELVCGSQIIEDETERKIAFFLMMFGKWEMQGPIARLSNGKVDFAEYVFEPQETSKNKNFEVVGTLSEMITSHYNQITATEKEIEYIMPTIENPELSIMIPKNYKGKQLPLWIFTIKPSE